VLTRTYSLELVDPVLAQTGRSSGGIGCCQPGWWATRCWHLRGPDGTTDTGWVGEHRYTRDGSGPWQRECAPGLVLRFPARNWSEQAGNVVDLGAAAWHGTPADGSPSWTWPTAPTTVCGGRADRILHERMDAPGHFMDRDYTAYGVAVTIIAPR
jgi:hypothetical protein